MNDKCGGINIHESDDKTGGSWLVEWTESV